MIAITIATPSAAPTWRATEFIPVAVAKLSPGAEATAVPDRTGNSVPAPIPSSTIPGSHWPAKSGVTPTRSTNHSTAPPHSRPPATRTARGPMRWASRLAGPATTTATAGPTVSARPVWRIEHRQRRGDQQPAERGAESGGGRADRGQQGHAVAAVRGRERMQHQRQGGRHEEGGAERLHHPERDQRARRRRDRAQQRAG